MVQNHTFIHGRPDMKKATAILLGVLAIGLTRPLVEASERHVIEVGPEISHITYREPGVARERGLMYGVAASYTYRGLLAPSPTEAGRIILRLDARGSAGEVDYANSGRVENILDYMLEGRGVGGYVFVVTRAITLTPYAGIGYRYLNDDLGGKISTTGAVGYERESNYLYSPLGIEALAALGSGWTVGVTAEYDLFWWGRQISHLSDVNSGFNDPRNDQHAGYGLRGAVRLQKQYRTVAFMAEPFIRYWNIKKSDDANWTFRGVKIGTVTEPKNHSTEFGLRLAVRF
jgi:hypothetical protein